MLCFLTYGGKLQALRRMRTMLRADGLWWLNETGLVKCPKRDVWRAWVHFSHWLIEARLHRFLLKENIQQLAWILFMLIKVLQKKMTSYRCHWSHFIGSASTESNECFRLLGLNYLSLPFPHDISALRIPVVLAGRSLWKLRLSSSVYDLTRTPLYIPFLYLYIYIHINIPAPCQWYHWWWEHSGL